MVDDGFDCSFTEAGAIFRVAAVVSIPRTTDDFEFAADRTEPSFELRPGGGRHGVDEGALGSEGAGESQVAVVEGRCKHGRSGAAQAAQS